jgi:hypothetical protein
MPFAAAKPRRHDSSETQRAGDVLEDVLEEERQFPQRVDGLVVKAPRLDAGREPEDARLADVDVELGAIAAIARTWATSIFFGWDARSTYIPHIEEGLVEEDDGGDRRDGCSLNESGPLFHHVRIRGG